MVVTILERPSRAIVGHLRALGRMLHSERQGVTALEYGIVAAFLCLSLLGIFHAFGSVLTVMFNGVDTSL
jgi:Flp pilus assembly pilin Flp